MKKVLIIFLVITILFMLKLPVSLAAKDDLIIDNQNIYEGMERSYSKGYKPIIKDDKAIIVLPLLYEGDKNIVDNKIKISPDLGESMDSPFSYANYEMDINLTNNPINNGKSYLDSFLVRLEIPLEKNRINGNYPIIINTSYSLEYMDYIEPNRLNSENDGEIDKDSENNKSQETSLIFEDIDKSFTVYLTIKDGKDPNYVEVEPEPEAEPEPRPQPKIIIDEYEINPGVVMAGEEFVVKLSLKNTEKVWSAKNIKVSFAGESDDILPASKTNSFFIDDIPKESFHKLVLEMRARTEAEAKPQKILITIEYEDSERRSYTVNEEILLEVRQPLRLEMDEINIPSTVYAGDSLPITTNIFNMGRSSLYNVRCQLKVPGLIPEGSAYLGKMEPGSFKSAEIYTFVGTIDMTEESNKKITEKYGFTEGLMTVSYEDEYGEEHIKTLEFSTIIEKPVFQSSDNNEKDEEEKPERASQWWVSIIILLGILMILFGFISYKRKLKLLRTEYGDEDL